MTLEFEKLTDELREIALVADRQRQKRTAQIERLLEALHTYATDWAYIDERLHLAQTRSDPKHYHSARPLTQDNPLDARIPAPVPPAEATIVATDGSQILPDRHAPFLYYLINVGGIIYYHGNGRSPHAFSQPQIQYLGDTLIGSGEVSVQRDLQEISTLADNVIGARGEAQPILGIVDQRLLYWPIGGQEAMGGNRATRAVDMWVESMTAVHNSGGLLAGYIDRPAKQAVTILLQALAADADFDWKTLGRWDSPNGVMDAALFSYLLQPGERSKLFLDISKPNELFAERDRDNQVCFFYLNPGQQGRQIARVDIPLWVAEKPEAVTAVHALIYDQCQLLGNYPYVLARADEMAVVTHREREELDLMIDLLMQEQGIESDLTGKQQSKDLARAGKTRHGGVY